MSDTPTLLNVFVSWFPMLLLIAVWVYFMRHSGVMGKGKMSNAQYMEGLLVETKRHNVAIEEILSKNNALLEQLLSRNK